jgi:iron uptake system component EfeO
MPQMTWLQVIAWGLYRGRRHDLRARLRRRRRRPSGGSRPHSPTPPSLIRKEHHDPDPHPGRRRERGDSRLALAGCVAKTDAAASGALTVSSTDSACDVSTATATSGTLTFDVTNAGSEVTEFYLLAEDGLRIVGEVENIAPGASRSLTVVAQPGDYFTLQARHGRRRRRQGVVHRAGEKIAATGDDAEQKQKAVDLYAAFVKDQVEQLVPAVDAFTTAYASGDDATARNLFRPLARSTSASNPSRSRSATSTRASTTARWTPSPRASTGPASTASRRTCGSPRRTPSTPTATPAWKDWAPSTPAERLRRPARRRRRRAEHLRPLPRLHRRPRRTGDRRHLERRDRLLDEVATGKISGEEDWWSGTDLYDFAANVEGSKMAFSLVQDFATASGEKGAALVTKIQQGYDDLDVARDARVARRRLRRLRELTEADKREFTDLINALAEPLSQLTSTILE